MDLDSPEAGVIALRANIMEEDFKLEEDIFSNSAHYFFSLLGPRFDAMNGLMAAALQKKFGHKFRPIKVFATHPDRHFGASSYVVLNKRAQRAEHRSKKLIIWPQKQEDLNVEFCQSDLVKQTVQKLYAKQGKVFVYPFTTSFLATQGELTILGSLPRIATQYDNKIQHWQLFQKLGLPTIVGKVFENKAALIRAAEDILPCYLAASYSSGGEESALIENLQALKEFLSRLQPVNAEGRFLAAKVFESIAVAPNVSAIVTGKNRTKILFITDQILRGNKYLGNVYPSVLSKRLIREINTIAITVGNYLSAEGYRGLFGLDFLVNDKDELVVIDLNPRRQGGYACNALALKRAGIDLADAELRCALGEKDNTDWQRLSHLNPWAHSKVIPPVSDIPVVEEIHSGDMAQIFSAGIGCYQTTFYKSGSIFMDGYVGYVATVGSGREEVYAQVRKAEKELLEKVFK